MSKSFHVSWNVDVSLILIYDQVNRRASVATWTPTARWYHRPISWIAETLCVYIEYEVTNCWQTWELPPNYALPPLRCTVRHDSSFNGRRGRAGSTSMFTIPNIVAFGLLCVKHHLGSKP